MSFSSGFIPVIPVKNLILFPEIGMPLRVGRERSLKALKKSLRDQRWLVILTQKDANSSADSFDGLYQTGTLCKIESHKQETDGNYNLFIKAHQRVRVIKMQDKDGFFEALVEPIETTNPLDLATRLAMSESIKSLANEVLELLPGDTQKVSEWLNSLQDLEVITNVCGAHAEFSIQDKQSLLEISDERERAMKLLSLLQNLKERLKIQNDLRNKLSENFSQNQKENILREQMRVIREELGEGDSDKDYSKLKEKIIAAKLPEEANELAMNQLKRLNTVPSSSPEHQMIRTHLELMADLPWSKSSEQKEINLDLAEKILNEDHFGLDKIKKRILQHLAVMKLRKTKQGSIMLFVGPPGVGKTSLGKSIAKALGKKYVRVSIGGIRDDAEIRGHRRTYIGALPGRIISGIKKAQENDPVFILDEIDKLSRGFSGDPASALLEVLDPEQNDTFQDHYLDTAFDLSKVFFIATANSLESIPLPLLDRMEVIDLTGYTIEEKRQIAKRYLWPKQLEEHGIAMDALTISDAALTKLMVHYTREAGVRDLQRKIATICKHMSLSLARGTKESTLVDVENLEDIFGQERFNSDMIESVLPAGVVTGLAWTPVGGDILFIESASMPGNGQLVVTGQLGEVMQESVKIALSLLKSRLHLVDPLLDLSKKDIHVHVPAGAIPKDGPSAGVTMLTSLASMLLKKPVNPKLAMTGEISLRGSVLPVGGIKEKVIAAHRSGVKEIIMSEKNERDLKEVPEDIRKGLEFTFVSNIDEVLMKALGLDLKSVVPESSSTSNATTIARD